MQRLDVLKNGGRFAKVVIPATTALLMLAFFAGSALLYRRSLAAPSTVPGIILERTALPAIPHSELDQVVDEEARRYLDGEVTLRLGTHQLKTRRRDIGARVDVTATRKLLLKAGKTGSFFKDLVKRIQARRSLLRLNLVTDLDHAAALGYFMRLKEKVDRPSEKSRLNLDKRVVIPGADGFVLRVHDCLVAAELAMRNNRRVIPLAVTINKAGGGRSLEKLDISHVMGHFTTVYSLADKDLDRGFNLKVGASKLDGKIIMPGEVFSFNAFVGERTKAAGYRTATVISQGELVDGMAGGACQLSSTLFAASFFAGLGLESSRPHTRPSSYIKMGLDATVNYPTTDLVLRNTYSFPVAIHFKVNRGKVRVRILGKKRPWNKVVFEREVKEVLPFKTVIRKDNRIPTGHQVVKQRGVPGFKLVRRRLLYSASKKPAKVESRDLTYPPTTQYVHQGTGAADPRWAPPKERPPFGEVPPVFTLNQ